MPQVGIKYAGVEYTWDEARELAENPTFPYPPPLIEAMADSRDDKEPSASSIVGCLRRFELQRKVSYYAEAGGELAPLFGTAYHALMEKHQQRTLRPGDLAETRLFAKVVLYPGNSQYSVVNFGGQMDFFRPGVLIRDWKSKKYIPRGFTPPSEHVGQVNIYNWLAAENGLEAAPTWELVYVTQGWVQREHGPTTPVAAIGNYVRERLIEWASAARRGALPAPVPQLFQADERGNLPAPCSYCPVREQCLAALKRGEGKPF